MKEVVFERHQAVAANESADVAGKLLQLWVGGLVARESLLAGEALATQRAHVHQAGPMFLCHVVLDTSSVSVSFLAQAAAEWLDVLMSDHVTFKVITAKE